MNMTQVLIGLLFILVCIYFMWQMSKKHKK
ncbi:hypothetical protein ERICI_03075 [Paenibacillus larvae subsp. larvae]|uniref:Uncharacterized protein n=1 Tax=Paenibacillus larvae subsp. larvae DSM 25430 TaxID=697284 RepID=V9WAF5_9BACL|nr:hypothetical protein ERIC2_c30640 [Paenibacillus larvae subsp. larvae DSM 25430]AVF22883.1 hypothetical protein ERICI_03075 [Paenibacillus larvae subsp. larvae]AVF32525.1 hypothetical protein ERICIV_03661 [Paenibacillus larvae subsp. larvae]AVG13405.1 hypothetical protein ERICII_03066 [Paenibacillus larvae subsp. larvae DSM 25430]ETK26459.1 hypothetical protein ERIC1_2c06810 [Paenibacillus larvae subsp. larvae DSM 25719]